MPTSSLPLDIKETLSKHIESVGQLEVLLLFYDHQDRDWTPDEISRELRSHTTSAAKQMAQLAQHGFISNTPRNNAFKYAPQTQILGDQVHRLHSYYKEMSVSIIAFIYEKPQDKLKGFADAFKLRKD